MAEVKGLGSGENKERQEMNIMRVVRRMGEETSRCG
jgi:hypothetical protein